MLKAISTALQMLSITIEGTTVKNLIDEWTSNMKDIEHRVVYNSEKSNLGILNKNIKSNRRIRFQIAETCNPYELVDSFPTWAFDKSRIIAHMRAFDMDFKQHMDIIDSLTYYKAISRLLFTISAIDPDDNLQIIPLSFLCSVMFWRIDFVKIQVDPTYPLDKQVADLKNEIKTLICFLVKIFGVIKNTDPAKFTPINQKATTPLLDELKNHLGAIKKLVRTVQNNIQLIDANDINERQNIRELFFIGEIVIRSFEMMISYIEMSIETCPNLIAQFRGVCNDYNYILMCLIYLSIPQEKITELLTTFNNITPKITFKLYERLVPYSKTPNNDRMKDAKTDQKRYDSLLREIKLGKTAKASSDFVEIKLGDTSTDKSRMWKNILIIAGVSIVITIFAFLVYFLRLHYLKV